MGVNNSTIHAANNGGEIHRTVKVSHMVDVGVKDGLHVMAHSLLIVGLGVISDVHICLCLAEGTAEYLIKAAISLGCSKFAGDKATDQ